MCKWAFTLIVCNIWSNRTWSSGEEKLTSDKMDSFIFQCIIKGKLSMSFFRVFPDRRTVIVKSFCVLLFLLILMTDNNYCLSLINMSMSYLFVKTWKHIVVRLCFPEVCYTYTVVEKHTLIIVSWLKYSRRFSRCFKYFTLWQFFI